MGAGRDDEDSEEAEVTTHMTVDRPRRLQAANVKLKREDPDAGLIRCPACGCGVSVGTRGCSVTTCTNASSKHMSKSGRRGARERERERQWERQREREGQRERERERERETEREWERKRERERRREKTVQRLTQASIRPRGGASVLTRLYLFVFLFMRRY